MEYGGIWWNMGGIWVDNGGIWWNMMEYGLNMVDNGGIGSAYTSRFWAKPGLSGLFFVST